MFIGIHRFVNYLSRLVQVKGKHGRCTDAIFLGSDTPCPIYSEVKFRAIGQHHTEQPRQWIASRHVTANKGEVIMITTNWMVEVSRTLPLAHIYNFFPKISFRAMVILTRSASTRSYQYRNALAASHHRINIICTSVRVSFIDNAKPYGH